MPNFLSIKNFDATATDTQTAPLNMGTSSFTNGWKAMHYTGLDDVVKGYVENGQFVKDAWKNIAVNSTTYTFHFEDTEIMTTGFYFDEDDEEEPDEGEEESGGEEEQETIPEVHAYYFCDDNIVNTSCELGAMQTGLQTIHNDIYGNDYKYYFRTSANQFSEGAKGEMVTGLTAVGPTDDDTYFFRRKEDEILPGPVGSALTNGCIRPDSQNLSTKICFDGDGKKTTGNKAASAFGVCKALGTAAAGIANSTAGNALSVYSALSGTAAAVSSTAIIKDIEASYTYQVQEYCQFYSYKNASGSWVPFAVGSYADMTVTAVMLKLTPSGGVTSTLNNITKTYNNKLYTSYSHPTNKAANTTNLLKEYLNSYTFINRYRVLSTAIYSDGTNVVRNIGLVAPTTTSEIN